MENLHPSRVRLARRKLAAAVLVCIAAAAVFALLALPLSESEPSYQGKKLSEWLKVCDESMLNSPEESKARNAIRAMGTNALPHLVGWIDFEQQPDRVRRAASWLMIKIPTLKKITPLNNWVRTNTKLVRVESVPRAFEFLGSAASPAIPELVHLANRTTNSVIASFAIEALGAIGPDSLPALIGILTTNQVHAARCLAIQQVARFEEQSSSAVPALVERLHDKTYSVAESSVSALARIKARPDVAVPALIDCLRNPFPFEPSPTADYVRGMFNLAIVDALHQFGSKANAAVPILLECLHQQDNEDSMNCKLLVTLSSAAEQPQTVIPTIAGYLQSTNGLLRHCAALALANLGPRAITALPDLTNALRYAESQTMVTKAILKITSGSTTNAPAN